jgi:hypothetical protein
MRFAIALVLLAAPSVAMGQGNDFVLVPGLRVGPLTGSAVKADVPRLFPGATVKDDELELDEGYVLQATFVNREKRPESMAIVWSSDGHPKQVYLCRGRGRGECKWHATAPGGNIGVGVKMLDLEKINGKPFTIHGFGYGYGGNIEAWDGGKIEKFDCNNSLLLGVDGVRNREGDFTVSITSEEKQSFSGNRSIPTTNEGLRKLNPAITDVVFNFAEPGAKSCGN